MPVERQNRDGMLDILHRRGGSASLRRAGAVVGCLLCLAPTLLLPGRPASAWAGMVLLEILVLAVAGKLLAEVSRRELVRARLHIATGEVEIRSGRGLAALTRAFGSVEVDRVLLSRKGPAPHSLFDLHLVPRSGAPVAAIAGDPDEPACLDAALVLAQGMGVPLEDRRWPTPPPATGGEPVSPSRVARHEEGARRVYTWEYRDRFRPLVSLLALGAAAALAAALPTLATVSGLLVIGSSILLVALALGLAGHAVLTLSTRRVTLRPDAVRVERHLASLPLSSRLTLYEEMKAVLLLPRGPLATLSLRAAGSRHSAVLPFEDPLIAGWLRNILQRAAHDAGRRKNPLSD